MRRIFIIIICVVCSSCNNIEFVYKNDQNLLNPLYEKTNVINTGFDLPFMKSYIPMFFGVNKNQKFNLIINIEEQQTKRSVEINQVTSNLRYELRFFYLLRLDEKNCKIFEKENLSSFIITPKSSGYNYGTDASLDRKYELAVTENLNRFISFLSDDNVKNCI